jgi:hypothetical protein
MSFPNWHIFAFLAFFIGYTLVSYVTYVTHDKYLCTVSLVLKCVIGGLLVTDFNKHLLIKIGKLPKSKLET